jgi:hypothetical protein
VFAASIASAVASIAGAAFILAALLLVLATGLAWFVTRER